MTYEKFKNVPVEEKRRECARLLGWGVFTNEELDKEFYTLSDKPFFEPIELDTFNPDEKLDDVRLLEERAVVISDEMKKAYNISLGEFIDEAGVEMRVDGFMLTADQKLYCLFKAFGSSLVKEDK